MITPLNPLLYRRLQEEFGSVATSHPGVASSFTYGRSITDGSLKTRMISSGEYYRVNCPYCGDSKGRLWINHMWGVPDAITNTRNLWTAICYNENCLTVDSRCSELYDRIYGFKNVFERNRPIVIHQGEVKEQELTEVVLPGLVVRLNELPYDSPACTYIRSRNLDPVILGNTFSVSYCFHAFAPYLPAQDKIIIPIIMHKTIVGWQCRYAADIDFKTLHIPKYYNMPNMPKRLMLYNYDNAKEYPFVVVTEGVTDVWAIGKYSVALLGKKPSLQQLRLLSEGWDGGAIIIMLDGDAWEATLNIVELLKQNNYNGVIIPIALDKEKDPGELDVNYLANLILDAASNVGVDLVTLTRSKDYDGAGRGKNYRSPSTTPSKSPGVQQIRNCS